MRRWLATAALLLAVATSRAAFERPNWRWWANPAIAAEIGLTPAQAAAIERAQAESRAGRAAIGRDLRTQRQRLGALLSAPQLDRPQLVRVLGDVFRLERAQLRSVIHLRLRVRRILTPTQLSRLLAAHPDIMERPWDNPAPSDATGLRPSGGLQGK